MGFFRQTPRSDFERDVLPHLPALYGVAVRLTRNPSDAEDLVQEAILRAYRFWDGFEQGTNAKAWLCRILTNAFRNRYREREREREVLADAGSSDANLDRFVGPGPRDAEQALFGGMLSRDIEEALAALPPEFRLAVVLADLEDFSYKEIADIVGCPAGTVMSRLYRGRRRLQKLLVDRAVEAGIVAPPAAAANPPAPVDLDAYRKKRGDGGAA